MEGDFLMYSLLMKEHFTRFGWCNIHTVVISCICFLNQGFLQWFVNNLTVGAPRWWSRARAKQYSHSSCKQRQNSWTGKAQTARSVASLLYISVATSEDLILISKKFIATLEDGFLLFHWNGTWFSRQDIVCLRSFHAPQRDTWWGRLLSWGP